MKLSATKSGYIDVIGTHDVFPAVLLVAREKYSYVKLLSSVIPPFVMMLGYSKSPLIIWSGYVAASAGLALLLCYER